MEPFLLNMEKPGKFATVILSPTQVNHNKQSWISLFGGNRSATYNCQRLKTSLEHFIRIFEVPCVTAKTCPTFPETPKFNVHSDLIIRNIGIQSCDEFIEPAYTVTHSVKHALDSFRPIHKSDDQEKMLFPFRRCPTRWQPTVKNHFYISAYGIRWLIRPVEASYPPSPKRLISHSIYTRLHVDLGWARGSSRALYIFATPTPSNLRNGTGPR